MKPRLLILFLLVCFLVPDAYAQGRKSKPTRFWKPDTDIPTYVDTLEGITVTAKRKGKEWRKHYKLVHNFSKAYPYALVAKEILQEADSTITFGNLNKRKRNQYIKILQEELFDTFEEPIRKMTITQGKILLKLIDRETGITPYEIIRTYTNKAAAAFWQGIAKLFGSDMKIPYDPEGEDAKIEELVLLYQQGKFRTTYRNIFGKEPPEPVVRAKNDFPQL